MQAVGSLSQEFQRACVWLAQATRSGWDGTQLDRPPRGVSSVLSEPHRIIVQDWFLSDTAYLTGWLLHRVVGQLQALVDAPDHAHAPASATLSCTHALDQAAGMLERAGALAGECIAFAEQSRRRWRALCEQIDEALAEPSHGGIGMQAQPAPRYAAGRTWR